MSSRTSRSYLVPHLLRRLFGKRETIAYPAGPLVLPEAYRGRVTVDIAKCTGCGLCARDCPCAGLEVERLNGGGVRVTLYHDRCANCGLCELGCRRGAIHLTPRIAPSVSDLRELCEQWERSEEG
ncbi:MAG: hypothetical protein FJZ90_00950 [Chloroflexi bacterium]|nr:hypothetical protein [Chloroflexota bacterium]